MPVKSRLATQAPSLEISEQLVTQPMSCCEPYGRIVAARLIEERQAEREGDYLLRAGAVVFSTVLVGGGYGRSKMVRKFGQSQYQHMWRCECEVVQRKEL
jgi:hypothetical protein